MRLTLAGLPNKSGASPGPRGLAGTQVEGNLSWASGPPTCHPSVRALTLELDRTGASAASGLQITARLSLSM